MSVTEVQVPYAQGHIAVRDHGGSGRDVLLVHTPGLCALTWDVTATELQGRVHAYAIDLPGHAHSPAELTTFDDTWRSLAAVTRELGLDRPILVSHDMASFVCLVAAASEPELYSAVVTVGGSCVRSRAESAEHVAFLNSPDITVAMRERFQFGARSQGPNARQEVIDRVWTAVKDDWLVEGIAEEMREELIYSLRDLPGGEVVNTPTLETMQRLLKMTSTTGLHPDSDIYSCVELPTWLVQLSDGFDARASEAERELAATLPQLRHAELTSGQWPQYSAAAELAELIVHIAEDPARAGVDLADGRANSA